ncbi:lipoprotein [Erwinia phage vB_EamP-S6]|uniref:Serine protease n=1 Tax=Erwinia phage vB_EamP-S6 TaxID=1051675 RepID=G0YQD7_9CAUD|nr:lipoprotein [Erwinia phage vB_EamP-S6]AEJ81564.1 serine protease [Erwinia phage vB_EamP-S6]
MRKILIAAAILGAVTTLTGCYERVEPGNAGVLVNRLGDEKGVDAQPLGVGRYWVGWNEDLYTFPTFKQMKSYPDPFIFQMSDGTTIGYSIGIAYRVTPAKVTTVFQTYRKGVDDITDTDLRQKISDSLNRRSSMMNTDKFIDGGKGDILTGVLSDLQKEMGPVGIEVLSVSWMGKPDYPPTVIESINAKVTANQKTLQREQEVKQRDAEANMLRAEAAGQADAKLALANAEAKSIEIRGKALRENPEIMNLEAINKWNGTLPTTMVPGAATPFISIK